MELGAMQDVDEPAPYRRHPVIPTSRVIVSSMHQTRPKPGGGALASLALAMRSKRTAFVVLQSFASGYRSVSSGSRSPTGCATSASTSGWSG